MEKVFEALDRITNSPLDVEYFYKQEKIDEEIIKQSLIKAQEQEKALKNINEKIENHLKKWSQQLKISGVNSKSMVLNDIQYLLKKMEENE